MTLIYNRIHVLLIVLIFVITIIMYSRGFFNKIFFDIKMFPFVSSLIEVHMNHILQTLLVGIDRLQFLWEQVYSTAFHLKCLDSCFSSDLMLYSSVFKLTF